MQQLDSHPRDLVMGALAGGAAIAARTAAHALYEAGGRDILPPAAQVGLQTVLTRTAVDTVATVAPALLAEGVALAGAGAVAAAVAPTARVTALTTARAAGAQLARTTARAGLVGLVVDAAFGAAEGFVAYRRGAMTGKQACVHASLEAGTGAASTSIGVLLAAGAVALTGGLAGPAVMAIGTGCALASKLGLRRLLARSRPASPVAPLPAVAPARP